MLDYQVRPSAYSGKSTGEGENSYLPQHQTPLMDSNGWNLISGFSLIAPSVQGRTRTKRRTEWRKNSNIGERVKNEECGGILKRN